MQQFDVPKAQAKKDNTDEVTKELFKLAGSVCRSGPMDRKKTGTGPNCNWKRPKI